MPAIQGFEENIRSFNHDLEQQKLVVRRFDEVILEKASKFHLQNLEDKLGYYLSITQHNEYTNSVQRNMEEINSRLEAAQMEIQQLRDQVKQDITVANKQLGSNFRTEMELNLQKGNFWIVIVV